MVIGVGKKGRESDKEKKKKRTRGTRVKSVGKQGRGWELKAWERLAK